MKNDLHTDGFCAQKFYPTEAAFLSTLLAYNLLAVYQAHGTAKADWRKPSTLRAASSGSGQSAHYTKRFTAR